MKQRKESKFFRWHQWWDEGMGLNNTDQEMFVAACLLFPPLLIMMIPVFIFSMAFCMAMDIILLPYNLLKEGFKWVLHSSRK